MDAATRQLVRRRAKERCEYCRLPRRGRMFNPRTQEWGDHFTLVGFEILGLTPVGRATARLLNMNAEGRMKARAALVERGELDSE